jgi:hypothetical protein
MGRMNRERGGVTWRSVALGLLLIPVAVYWITIIEVRWFALDGTCLPMFIIPIFLLFLMTMVNRAFARRKPLAALNQGELLTVYTMIVLASVMASHDLFQNMFGSIGHAYYMASAENKWQELFFRYLPKWLLVTDTQTLKSLYQGGVDPFQKTILVHWLVPLAGWMALMLVTMAMMLCGNLIIRKQWTENEKLVFPLVQLPIAITEGGGNSAFFRNRMMWAGFSIAFLIGTINGLQYLFPSLPAIPGVKPYDIGQHVVAFPWVAIGSTPISMYPFAIGMAYFIPLDLSFSCWFFYVGRKLLQVAGASYGWAGPANAGFPFFDEQASGAWIALGISVLWVSRKFLMDVLRVAAGRAATSADASEAGSYRIAIAGIILGTILIAIFSKIIGLTAWVAMVFFGIYFLLSITITRVRAELGTPHEIYFVNPQRIMVSVFGEKVIGPANLTLLSVMYWFNRGYRSHPMPNQLEAFKMTENTNVKRGQLVWVMALATVVGILVTYWANLQVSYDAGAMGKCLGFKSWVGEESYGRLATWLSTPEPRAPSALAKFCGPWLTTRMAYMIAGAAVVTVLRGMRGAFIWWPFHPAGYALAVSYAMDYFWFAFFVGWLIKAALVRYGGMKLHNYAVPFFLGLILGDFTVGSIWAIVCPLIGLQTYKIFI